ncbi:hypothetical protein VNI00_015934 [Paramarasmius palmivorus]|uniref:Uncharacterized protein n=1 Tax=Paramarasmius palmivorus TaxID=297713 RepID=A0AAW0BJI6_9AGAR
MATFVSSKDILNLTWIGDRRLLAGCRNGRMYAVDPLEKKADMRCIQVKGTGDITSVAKISEVDGSQIVAVCIGNNVELWGIPRGKVSFSSRLRTPLELYSDLQTTWNYMGKLPRHPLATFQDQSQRTFVSAFALDPSTLLVSYAERAVVIWELNLQTNPVEADVVDGMRATGHV